MNFDYNAYKKIILETDRAFQNDCSEWINSLGDSKDIGIKKPIFLNDEHVKQSVVEKNCAYLVLP